MVSLLKKIIFFQPEIDEAKYILIDTSKGCKNQYFHSLE